MCVADGCGVGADFCQPHHVKAYKNGGKTVTSNLAMLCAYDNGRNDDDPEKPMHGREEKIDGLEMWVPAFGGDPKLNMHPTALGGAIRLAKKMAEL
ncbi:HNH endonuclease signature motif containing protein [Corynebacterium pyruviciproducens]|uniref:HNH endonuclease signature motif containing protein n=1 Tax=Corynebacterium pyruviciproducens TaxID=598660 RepID=A0AAF0YRA4_9CORY|nr:HNH endonuclease signature motif containing protein [Corynebacterium pyruviciproducens]WOT02697.1 HNH endonuclease signature motif containing protein [Corynebacterium pyruviciproducens]